MPLVAQLPHHPAVLDLGDDRWVLHLFMCANGGLCETWDGNSGCNAAIVLGNDELETALAEPPPGLPLNGEVFISGWSEQDDGIEPARLPEFLDAEAFWRMPATETGILDFRLKTKCGGVPYWTANGPQAVPPAPFVYLMQMDTVLFVDGDMPSADEAGCSIQINHPTRVEQFHSPPESVRPNSPNHLQQVAGSDFYCVDWVNFGSDGTAYVFINRKTNPPQVHWYWNR